VVEDRYQFRPPYNLRDKKGLIKLLKRRDLKGEGGVMYDDIIESLGEFNAVFPVITFS
jgi:transcription initiation factor TFIIE subunit beta